MIHILMGSAIKDKRDRVPHGLVIHKPSPQMPPVNLNAPFAGVTQRVLDHLLNCVAPPSLIFTTNTLQKCVQYPIIVRAALLNGLEKEMKNDAPNRLSGK
jgi:hypothetical protein